MKFRYTLVSWAIRGVLAGLVLVLLLGSPANAVKSPPRPNILLILTDQQHAGMLSCTGNRFLKTPAMDSLASAGARFELAYCANPVCVPSRFSLMTGHMPSRIGMRENGDIRKVKVPEAILEQSMGRIFKKAGYEVSYGGKVHLPMSLESMGFDCISEDERSGLADACVEFMKRKRDNPFLLVASFINPHDICYMAINAMRRSRGRKLPAGPHQECVLEALRLPEGVTRGEFFERICPPLPDNHEIPPLEPEVIQTKIVEQDQPFRGYVRKHWSDEQWRLHRWAYCRLTERVDAEIGKVLRALRDSGLEENTLIIFSSDHGDMDSAHRLEHKSCLYEEATRIPFIVSFTGVTRPGLVDREHLVSNGLDLIPTMCDYAGIRPPQGLLGRSVRALAEGRQPASWRDRLVVEDHFGRMVRTSRYKYNVYDSGEHREQLIDLEKDPGEMKNLAEDPAHRKVLEAHRRMLRQWVEKTNDELAREYIVR